VGDVHIKPPEPNKVGAKVAELVASGHEFYATAVTGSADGRTRRPTLFIIAMTGTALASLGFAIAGIVAIIAILALALTDAVVAL